MLTAYEDTGKDTVTRGFATYPMTDYRVSIVPG